MDWFTGFVHSQSLAINRRATRRMSYGTLKDSAAVSAIFHAFNNRRRQRQHQDADANAVETMGCPPPFTHPSIRSPSHHSLAHPVSQLAIHLWPGLMG